MTAVAEPRGYAPFAGATDTPEACENPRWDAGFIDRCLIDLMQHWGQWRRLGQLHAAEAPSFDRCCVVREAVDWGRRLGFAIEGDRQRGYRMTGFKHPERVYLIKPGASPRDEAEAQAPGQLTLVECAAVE